METEFFINGETLKAKDLGSDFTVHSNPKDYNVSLKQFNIDECNIETSVFIIDKNVKDIFYANKPINNYFLITSSEENKNIQTVLELIDFFTRVKVNKGSKIYAIGGGCVQDIVAFACKMYKRGVPWTFVPTTLLSQYDSCIGGKTALNHGEYKNILGLFSAPSEVIIDGEFTSYLDSTAMYSGLGEFYRLVFTGGRKLNNAGISYALAVKKAVVEEDEFESCLRMSMNYGHTIGHALEAYFNYSIPHGIAVMVGMIVENRLGNPVFNRDHVYMHKILREAVRSWDTTFIGKLKYIDNSIFKYLFNDKKTKGNKITFAYLEKLGEMYFNVLELNDKNKKFILDILHTIGDYYG